MKLCERWMILALVAMLAAPGCGLDTEEEGDLGDDLSTAHFGLSLSSAIYQSCTTGIVRGLSQQLVDEIQCLRPGTLERIDSHPYIDQWSVVIPYLQKAAANSLFHAASRKKSTIVLSSALRTLPQQYLLYLWYLSGRCGIGLAAYPGTSNHESGLAIDVANWSSWISTLQYDGFKWFGYSDQVHFDYVGSGTCNLKYLSVLAFQRLWNRNNPYDQIAEDGAFGSNTAYRLRKAPAGGFPIGASCNAAPPDPKYQAMEVYWHREDDGHYELRALGPSEVESVDYFVDGYLLNASKIHKAEGNNFPTSVSFTLEKPERKFEVRGYDNNGKQIALGIGLLDVTEGTGVFIKQMGDKVYEIGLERAPEGVASIEVKADTWLLSDSVSQSSRPRAPRLAVRSSFSQVGPRVFSITTFNADKSVRGTLHRTFSLW